VLEIWHNVQPADECRPPFDPFSVYHKGQTIYPPTPFMAGPWNKSSGAIPFFLTREEAEDAALLLEY
jgi:hypothetical protein